MRGSGANVTWRPAPWQDRQPNPQDSRLRGLCWPSSFPLVILNVPRLTFGDDSHLPESPGSDRASAVCKALPARKHTSCVPLKAPVSLPRPAPCVTSYLRRRRRCVCVCVCVCKSRARRLLTGSCTALHLMPSVRGTLPKATKGLVPSGPTPASRCGLRSACTRPFPGQASHRRRAWLWWENGFPEPPQASSPASTHRPSWRGGREASGEQPLSSGLTALHGGVSLLHLPSASRTCPPECLPHLLPFWSRSLLSPSCTHPFPLASFSCRRPPHSG